MPGSTLSWTPPPQLAGTVIAPSASTRRRSPDGITWTTFASARIEDSATPPTAPRLAPGWGTPARAAGRCPGAACAGRSPAGRPVRRPASTAMTEDDWAKRANEFRLLPGETLAGVLSAYEAVARRTDELLASLP